MSVAVLVIAAQAPKTKVQSAEKFVLVDSKGKERAVFGIDEKHGPALLLFDERGKLRVELGCDAPGIRIFDNNEKARAMLSVEDDKPYLRLFGQKERSSFVMLSVRPDRTGEIDTQSIILRDGNGKGRILLDSSDGQPSLQLLDDQLRVRASLMCTKSGNPAISLYDQDRKLRVQLLVDDKDPYLILGDDDDKAIIQLSIKKISGPSIEIMDEKGKKVFSKP